MRSAHILTSTIHLMHYQSNWGTKYWLPQVLANFSTIGGETFFTYDISYPSYGAIGDENGSNKSKIPSRN